MGPLLLSDNLDSLQALGAHQNPLLSWINLVQKLHMSHILSFAVHMYANHSEAHTLFLKLPYIVRPYDVFSHGRPLN